MTVSAPTCPPRRTSCRRRGRTVWAVFLSLALVSPAGAASPRDELLRLVPEDVGFVVVVQDLKAHFDAVVNSPFIEQFARSNVGEGLAKSPQAAQLLMLRDLFLGNIGLDAKDIRDEILGLAEVFAFRPGPPGKPEQDEGLFLVRAGKEKALQTLLDKINQYQKKAGDLKELEEKEYNGVKYVRRVESKDVTYYCFRGPVLILSTREEAILRALDRERLARADVEPPLVKRLRELGADQAFLTVWVNPRAFDAAIEAKASQAEGAPAAALKAFTRYWKALDGAAFSVHLDADLSFSLALRARTGELPPAARRFLDAASRPSAVWRAIPEDALYAEASRIDVAAYLELLGDFMTRESREALLADLNRYLGAPVGKDFVKDILPCIGPDWGLCVTAPRPEAKTWVPEAVCALRLSAGGEAADRAVLSGVQALAMLGVVAHNKQYPDRTLRLLTLRKGDKEVKYLDGDNALPPGLRPAFALDNGFLLAATSPERLLQFCERLSSAPQPEKAETMPVMWISFKAWRAYLTDHREALAEVIARKNEMDPEDAAKSLDKLLSGLQFIDRLEINQRCSAGQVVVTFRVQPSRPLKK
jgi:hypothetical protein